jgi:hypothetical protein
MNCHANTGLIQIHGDMAKVVACVRQYMLCKAEYIWGTARLNVTQASYKDKYI